MMTFYSRYLAMTLLGFFLTPKGHATDTVPVKSDLEEKIIARHVLKFSRDVAQYIDASGNENSSEGDKTILNINVAIPEVSESTDVLVDYSSRTSGEEKSGKRFGLSIDGGGFRGLMPAVWIAALDKKIGDDFDKKGITDVFDCVGGTSIGGILSLATVHPDFDVANLPNLLEENRKSIFPPIYGKMREKIDDDGLFEPFIKGIKGFFGWARSESKNLVAVRYKHRPLETLLQENLKETTLRDTKTDFLITACSTSGAPYAFTKDYKDSSIKLWELGRATSAAPTYFAPFKMSSETSAPVHLVDGGLWANNPSIFVAGHIAKKYHTPFHDLHVLSLGTGLAMMSRDIPTHFSGKLTAVGPIVDALMSSNSAGNHQAVLHVLGSENYTRVNPRLNRNIELDDISEEAVREMNELAKGSVPNIHACIDSWNENIRKKFEQAS